jgi:hypothetical protein
MKNKLIAVLAALSMVASASAVKVNNNLSINGFIDGSYQLVDQDAGNTQQLQGDEAEINFVVSNGAVSGLVAIDSRDVNNNTDLNIEQAHFTYDLGNGVSVTFGRYGSALGFEREDPAGLYTFSRAYDSNSAFNLGDVDSKAKEGITIAYSADAWSIAASFENNRGADIETDELDLEVSVSYTGIADTVIGGGYFFSNENTNAAGSGAANAETDILNLHASRSFGKLLVAAEYTELQNDVDGDTDGFLVLFDYDYNDKIGAALRFSNNERTSDNKDYEKVTIAPNYAITDNLGAILEYSDVDAYGSDSDEISIELTYTF